MIIPSKVFQTITWSPPRLFNRTSSSHCSVAPPSPPTSCSDDRALGRAHLGCPTDGSVHVCAHWQLEGLAHGRASPFTTLSHLTILCPPHLARRPTERSFSNFETFIQILIETKKTYIWRRAHLQMSLPYLGRAWGNSPLYSYSRAGRRTRSGSRLPGVSLNSGHFQAAEPSRASVKHNGSRTYLRALLQGFNERT